MLSQPAPWMYNFPDGSKAAASASRAVVTFIVVQCNTYADRFDVNLLDPADPFELDGDNLPHLFKHAYCDVDDIYDAYLGDPIFVPAERGNADWLMIGIIPGDIIVVPLASPRSGDHRKCRPIGLYKASGHEQTQYYSARRGDS